MDIDEIKPLDYDGASIAINIFDAVKTTSSYEDLLTLVEEGRLLFHSARADSVYVRMIPTTHN